MRNWWDDGWVIFKDHSEGGGWTQNLTGAHWNGKADRGQLDRTSHGLFCWGF